MKEITDTDRMNWLDSQAVIYGEVLGKSWGLYVSSKTTSLREAIDHEMRLLVPEFKP